MMLVQDLVFEMGLSAGEVERMPIRRLQWWHDQARAFRKRQRG